MIQDDIDISQFHLFENQNQYVFNYLLPNGLHNQGIIDENIDDEVFLPNHIENQYRNHFKISNLFPSYYTIQ